VLAVIPASPKGPHSTHDDASISLWTYGVIHQVSCPCPRTKLWQLNPRESSELVLGLNNEGALGECMIGSCHGVGTVASIVVRVSVRVRVSGGSGGLQNIRITERTQRFILVRADRCPSLATDDPYTQEHPKSGGLQQSV